MRVDALGESCLIWSGLPGPVLPQYRRLRAERDAGRLDVRDVVPAYTSLALHFDPLTTDPAELRRQVDAVLAEALPGPEPGPHDPDPAALPVRYDGPDLARVADHTGLDAARVIQRHAAPTYTVAAIGFLPHFPYLTGLDPALATPRLDRPRPRVPAGAVAIGHDQAGVYPQTSPGGWNLIGTTDPDLLVPLRPGDRLRFEPV